MKVRLGWDDKQKALEIADAVQQGGADEIAIHGRTKMDGYRADKIDWQKIGEVRQNYRFRSLPMVKSLMRSRRRNALPLPVVRI